MSLQHATLEIRVMQTQLRERLAQETSLASAAQRCVDRVYEEWRESLALVRLYATVPYQRLPSTERGFVDALAERTQTTALLQEETRCLTLLGTRGARPAWDHRLQSQGHIAIPLVSATFIEELPMVAALLNEVGVPPARLVRTRGVIPSEGLGALRGQFFVEDAKTAKDARGRLVIPAQDFVAAQGVETVFGVGTEHADGSFLAMLFFCTERLEKESLGAFTGLLGAFTAATTRLVLQRQFF